MEHEDRLEGYVSTYTELAKRTGSEDAAIAILIELGKDRRTSQINGNGHHGNGDAPATEKQLKLLDKLGVGYPSGVSKKEASRLIDEAYANGKH